MSDLDILVPADNEMPRYSNLGIVYEFASICFLKFWILCSFISLLLVLYFCKYGGIFPIIFLHIGIAGIFYRCQDMLLYHPHMPEDSRLYVPSPIFFGLQYETHYIHTPDGCVLHAYLLKQLENGRNLPTIIHFHGNAGNIGHRLFDANQLYKECGVNIILMEYRGYGKSTGSPSEAGLMLDASSTLHYFSSHPDLDPAKFILFGRSLGGAVAINAAASSTATDGSKPMALIVENTFTSIPNMAISLFKFKIFSYVPLILYRNKFLSDVTIRKITIPTLFLSGQRDELVPPSMMGYLFQICGSPMKRIVCFATGQHNDTWTCNGYSTAINKFISEVNDFRDGKKISAVKSSNV